MAKRDPSKTEAPTAKRKKDARREGRVAKSPDLFTWLAVLLLTYVVPGVVQRVGASLHELLAAASDVARDPDAFELPTLVGRSLVAVFTGMAPMLLAFMVLGVATGLAQVGFMFSGHALKPKMSRLSFSSGFKRMFSMSGLWGALAAMLRISVIVLVVYLMIDGLVGKLGAGAGRSPHVALADIATASITIARAVAAAAVVIALVDYAIKRRSLNAEMRMTKDEVRREMRESDGDPHVKAKLRSMRMAMGRNRMLAEIGSADVIITNPTHFAIAVAYQRDRGAPRVVARGADALAARIRTIGSEAGVPCVEAPPLARALYRVCRPGEEIPPELYQGVAVVLAFLHRLGAAHQAYGSGRVPVEVPDSWTPERGALERVPPGRRRAEARRAQRAAAQTVTVTPQGRRATADRSGAGVRSGELR